MAKVRYLEIEAGVRFWKNAIVDGVEDVDGDLIPCRQGDLWCIIIDVTNGKIINWEKGIEAEVNYKVCDNGTYRLYDSKNRLLVERSEIYVPSFLSNNGDYLNLAIDSTGEIEGWEPIEDFSFMIEDY